MAASDVHVCQCPLCRQSVNHPDRELHRQMNLFLRRLDEQQRRWYVALECKRVGYGGDTLLSQITGMDEKTISRGRAELESSLAGRPVDGVRLPGAGRPALEKKDPAITSILQELLEPETVGDPMSQQKWVRSSLRQLSQRMKEEGHPASHSTVGRLLGKLGYALHANAKKVEATASHADRSEQFE